jgi:hypothetical protein
MMASDVGVSCETTLLGACASDVLFMWDRVETLRVEESGA